MDIIEPRNPMTLKMILTSRYNRRNHKNSAKIESRQINGELDVIEFSKAGLFSETLYPIKRI